MEFEATQAMVCDDSDVETDDEVPNATSMKPVAQLKVCVHKDIKEAVYDIFEGSTHIGRDADSCKICLPFKSLSKEHACIEIADGVHLIYDLGSRNKTRRGKLYLRPQIRYELKHGDVLTFADIQCVYNKSQQPQLDSPVHAELPSETAKSKSSALFAVETDSEASDASSDILQPVEFDENLVVNDTKLVENSPPPLLDHKADGALLSKKAVDVSLDGFVPDSDCETDSDVDEGILKVGGGGAEVDESSSSEFVVQDTQAYDEGHDVLPKSSNVAVASTSETSVQDTQVFESNATEHETGSRDDQDLPTQCFEFGDLPTQTYGSKTENNSAGNSRNTNGSQEIATQSYDMRDSVSSQSSKTSTSAFCLMSTQTAETALTNNANDLAFALGVTQSFAPTSSSAPGTQSEVAITQTFDAAETSQQKIGRIDSLSTQLLTAETQVVEPQHVADSNEKRLTEMAATQTFDAAETSQQKISPESGSIEAMSTQLLTAETQVGEPQHVAGDNEKRLTFSPHSWSTQQSGPDDSCPHLQLDLSENTESGRERRVSAAGTLSPRDVSASIDKCQNHSANISLGSDSKLADGLADIEASKRVSSVAIGGVESVADNDPPIADNVGKISMIIGEKVEKSGSDESCASDSDAAIGKKTRGPKAGKSRTGGARLAKLHERAGSDVDDGKAPDESSVEQNKKFPDMAVDVSDLPTQVFDNFVEPEAPVVSSRQKRAAPGRRRTLNDAVPNADTADTAVRKSSRKSTHLVQLDKFAADDSVTDKETRVAKKPASSKNQVVVESQEIDADLLQTQLFEELDAQKPSVVVESQEIDGDSLPLLALDEPVVVKSVKKVKGQRKTESNTDDCQTQVFDEGGGVAADVDKDAKVVARGKRGSRMSAKAKQISNENAQSAAVSLVPVVTAASSLNRAEDSSWKESDASKLLDVLSTQVFSVETQEPDEPAAGSAVRGKTCDEAAEKVESTSGDELSGKKCATKKKGRLSSRKGSEQVQDEVLIAVETSETKVDSVEETSASRRQSSRAGKGKHSGLDVDSSAVTDKKRSTASPQTPVLVKLANLKSTQPNISAAKRDQSSVATKEQDKAGGKKRKLMPMDDIDAFQMVDSPKPVSQKLASPKADDIFGRPITLKAVKAKGQRKGGRQDVKAASAVEVSTQHESEAVASSQPADDEELPSLSSLLKPASSSNVAPVVESSPKTRTSAVTLVLVAEAAAAVTAAAGRRSNKKVSENVGVELSPGGSQEIPITCKDPEALQKRLSRLSVPTERCEVFASVKTYSRNTKKQQQQQPEKGSKDQTSSDKPSGESNVAVASESNAEQLDVNKNRKGPRSKSLAVGKPVETEVLQPVAVSKRKESSLQRDKSPVEESRNKRARSVRSTQSNTDLVSSSESGTSIASELATSSSNSLQKESEGKNDTSKKSLAKAKAADRRQTTSAIASRDDKTPATALVVSRATETVSSEEETKPRGRKAARASEITAVSKPTPSPSRGSLASRKPAVTNTDASLETESSLSHPKVMFTGVVDEGGEKLVSNFGGEIAESIYECTHLVTDQVRRTVKFLCGVARGIPVVTPAWLTRCKEAGTFVDASSFLVHDVANEQKFQFKLATSIKSAACNRLLDGYRVHVTANVKPEPNQMKDIIQCAGGKFLTSLPRAFEDRVVVVSCDDDVGHCRVAVQAGIPVVTSEFLLTGILRQKVDLESFKLSSANVSVTPVRGKRQLGGPSEVQAKAKRK